jgi:hypothetical protein
MRWVFASSLKSENIRENYIILNIQRFPFFPRAAVSVFNGVKDAHFARGSEHMLKKEDTIMYHKKSPL